MTEKLLVQVQQFGTMSPGGEIDYDGERVCRSIVPESNRDRIIFRERDFITTTVAPDRSWICFRSFPYTRGLEHNYTRITWMDHAEEPSTMGTPVVH